MSDLVEYYGTECHFCNEMAPLVERLKDEEGIEIEKIEVWHDEGNARKMQEEDQGECGGVPLFINRETGKKICGAASYEELVAWAKGE